jgi:hypothetical protein
MNYLLNVFSHAYDKCTTEERIIINSPLFVNCFTEHKTSGADSATPPHIFRAHPAYRGLRPWNDWVYVQYFFQKTDSRGRTTTTFFEDHLSKIIIFVDLNHSILPNMSNIEGYGSPGMYALVQMLEEQPEPLEKSVLLSFCSLSDKFYLVPTSSLRKPAFVVDNVGCQGKSLFVVPPIDEWAGLFL